MRDGIRRSNERKGDDITHLGIVSEPEKTVDFAQFSNSPWTGTKWLLDGSPIERTAALRKPYTDLPSTSGELDFPEKEMEAMLRGSLQNDDQLVVHAVGDQATELFLNAMDALAARRHGRTGACASNTEMESCGS